MKNKVVLKSFLLTLALVLTFSSALSLNVSAKTKDLEVQEATEILEALEQSSVTMPDNTVLINENQLEKLLVNNENYEEIKTSLEEENLLTTETNPIVAKAAASNINPKWENARDTCAKNYLKNQFGSSAIDAIFSAIAAGNIIYAVKELAKKGFNLTVPGLISLYAQINYTCIKEANSKYNIYK